MSKPIRDRILDGFIPEPNSGCWLWEGSSNKSGHCQIYYNKQLRYVHRLSYELFVGPIPKYKFILHKCDVASCINPDHLYVGTARDNVKDRVERKRSFRPKGELHPLAKMIDRDVIIIKSLYEDHKLSIADIASLFNMSFTNINRILRNVTWKHVER